MSLTITGQFPPTSDPIPCKVMKFDDFLIKHIPEPLTPPSYDVIQKNSPSEIGKKRKRSEESASIKTARCILPQLSEQSTLVKTASCTARQLSEKSAPVEKATCIPRLGLTPSGKVIALYITNALGSTRWDPYFEGWVENAKIHADYNVWHHQVTLHGTELDPPIDIRPFMKALHGLMPNMTSRRLSSKAYSYFPVKEKCQVQWAITQKAMKAIEHVPSNASVERYVLSSSDRRAFTGIISFSTLYEDYKTWCTKNGYASRKSLEKFIDLLSSSEPCILSREYQCILFKETGAEQKSLLPLLG